MTETLLELCYEEDKHDLIAAALEELDKGQVDELDVDWRLGKTDGLAGEPITVGVAIVGGAQVIIAFLRVFERLIEERRQKQQMEMVVKAAETNPDLARLLADLTAKHAEVSTSYKLINLSELRWGASAKDGS